MAAAEAAAAAAPPPPALAAAATTTPTPTTAHLLFSVALLPVVKVVMMCSVGAFFALERRGAATASSQAETILDAPGRRRLAALSYSLLTPALAFTSLAPTLTRDHILAWLPLGVNLLASVAMGLALGWGLCRALAVPLELRGAVTAATALGNAGNLPLVLMAAVVRQAGVAALGGGWGEEGERGGGGAATPAAAAASAAEHAAAAAAMQRRAVSYVAVNILASICTHFTVGARLLGGAGGLSGGSAAAAAEAARGAAAAATAAAAAPAASSTSKQQQRPQNSGDDDNDDDHRRERDGGGGGDRRALLPPPPASPGLSPRRGAAAAAAAAAAFQPLGPSISNSPPALALEVGAPTPPSSSSLSPTLSRLARTLAAAARALAKPPLLACFLAAAVGLGPSALRESLFPPPPADAGAPAHMGLLSIAADAARAFADATVPLLMLLLGATLTGVASASSSSSAAASDDDNGASPPPPLPARVVAGVVAARMVVLPLLGLGFVLGAYRTGVFPSPPPDRLFVVVLLLTHAVPTALNVHALSVLFCGPRAQAAMARLVLAQYVACIVTIPPALGVALAAARGGWVLRASG